MGEADFDQAFRSEFRQRHGEYPILNVSCAGADPADLVKPAVDGSIWPVVICDCVGDGGMLHREESPALPSPTLFDILEEMALALAKYVGRRGMLSDFKIHRYGARVVDWFAPEYLFEQHGVVDFKGATHFVMADISDDGGDDWGD